MENFSFTSITCHILSLSKLRNKIVKALIWILRALVIQQLPVVLAQYIALVCENSFFMFKLSHTLSASL